MQDNSGGGAVTAPNATGGDTAGSGSSAVNEEMIKNIVQKVTMGIFKEALPRMIEQSIQKAAPSLLDKIAEEALREDPAVTTQQPPATNATAAEEKTTLKSLRTQVENLQKALTQQQQAAQQAQQAARDARLRGEFQSKLASKIGADNPMLGHLMDSLYDVKKRVVEGPNGMPAVKFVDQWGNEELKPIDEGVAALFDGELKPFVQQSKAQNMPANGFQMRPQGMPFKPNQGQQRINPLLGEIANSLAETRPEGAQIILEDAAKLAAQSTPRK